ncbi:MAG: hypothetical protein JSS82_09225 [Bacteroidetes bacterium]|nr:hypothetical protein [Bacteroidota bacterium]
MLALRLKYSLLIACIIIIPSALAQTVPAARVTDWSHAGTQDSLPVYGNVVNIMDYGGVADGITPNDTPFQSALAALALQPGTIVFPAGSYMFHHSIDLRDSIVIKGADTSSRLLFDLGGSAQDMINIRGNLGSTIWTVNQYISKNDSAIYLDSVAGLAIGDWVLLYGNDSSLLYSSWAYETVGQIFRIKDIQGNKLISDMPLRRSYPVSFAARIKRIDPVKGVGIQCLYIERKDSTAQQTTNINFTNAVNSWVVGVESYNTNFAHIALTRSAHITVRGNYIHHSWHYGGSGQGYGVVAQYTSGDCLIDNNIFVHLRHSMLLQAGANGNVFAYNYSTDPHWDEPSLPANSAGDAVCHGNYPYLNLFEGNILQNIIVDDSHGSNGPFNTFFRDRAQLWGIVMNTTAPTDSMNFVGNEITNANFPYGNYSLSGSGHYQFGNNVHGNITPAGTEALADNSLFLNAPPGYWTAALAFPPVGTPYPYNSADNPARIRFANNDLTDCSLNPHFLPYKIKNVAASYDIKVYPDPFTDELHINALSALASGSYLILNVFGQALAVGPLRPGDNSIHFAPVCGTYFLIVFNSQHLIYQKQIVAIGNN